MANRKANILQEDIEAEKEYLDMMIRRKSELEEIRNRQIDFIEQIVLHDENRTFSEFGRSQVASYIRRFGFDEVCEATEIAVDRYACEGLSVVMNRVGGICYNRSIGRVW